MICCLLAWEETLCFPGTGGEEGEGPLSPEITLSCLQNHWSKIQNISQHLHFNSCSVEKAHLYDETSTSPESFFM